MILDAELFQSPEVDRTGATVGAKDLVALVQQQLGEVSTVLAGDAGDQSRFENFQKLLQIILISETKLGFFAL